MIREQFVKIARDVLGGNDRPVDECSQADIPGAEGRIGHECPLAVTNPASHEVPDWVIESMRRAYDAGQAALRSALDKGGGFTAADVSKAYDEGHAAGVKLESERPF